MNKMVQIFRDNCSHPRTGPFIKKGGFLLYFQLVYFWELNHCFFFHLISRYVLAVVHTVTKPKLTWM